jgi:DNA primase
MSIARHTKLNFIKSVFGSYELSSDGTNIAVVCPACRKLKNSFKKKLSIKADDDRYHCWVCNIKGKNLIPLLKKFATQEKLNEYVQKILRSKTVIDLSVDNDEPEKIQLPLDFVPIVMLDKKLLRVRRATNYLFSRGITERDLWYFRFGLSNYTIHKTRVIMPSFNADGDINYFTSRSYDKSETKLRYINAKISKLDIIFNEINIDWSKPLTLVEGPFDLIKCNDNATCLLGSTLSYSSRLFKQIVKNKTDIILSLDAGEHSKTHKIAKLLNRYGIQTWVADVTPYGPDPGSLTKRQFDECIDKKKKWNKFSRIGDIL